MRTVPTTRISTKGLTVWRWYGTMQTLVVLGVAIGLYQLFKWLDFPAWSNVALGASVVLFAFLFIYLFPKIRWNRWRYEVREAEIELQHGLFIVKRTLIPMVRVQHVDTTQGPLLRKYGLAVLTISTAATVHAIPAIPIAEADTLRRQISELARVAEDDV